MGIQNRTHVIWLLDDYTQLLPYAEEAHEYLQQPGQFDAGRFLRLCQSFSVRRCWILGDFRAALFGTCTPHPWSSINVGHLVWYYYRQTQQPGSGLYRLLQTFTRWATEQGAQEISLTQHPAVNPKITRLYKRLGYEPRETYFTLAL